MVQIKIERIDDTDIMIRKFRGVFRNRESLMEFIEEWYKKNPPRVWCAEIMGIDKKYGFKREFKKENVSYLESNKLGTRGVYCFYNLDEKHIYEISAPVSWRQRERYYCTVKNESIVRINKLDVENELHKKRKQ